MTQQPAQLLYWTAKEHYEVRLRNVQEQQKENNNNLFNLVGKFMELKPSAQTPLMILEDFSLECHMYVRVNVDIVSRYKCYMEPWYIFLFHQLKFTGTCSKNDEYTRKVYFGNADPERMTVFHLIENVDRNRFTFSAAAVPASITGLEWELVDSLRSKFSGRVQMRSICNLKSFHDAQKKTMKKKKDAPVLTSFLAQIVEFRHVQTKILAKVWDSTMPDFKVKLPITQANVQLEPGEVAMRATPDKDHSLSARSNRRTINVLIIGDMQTAKFNGKKPGDLVLFYNAKLFETADKTFKIEMSQIHVPFPEKQFVYFLGENTLLGRVLKSRVDPNRSRAPDSEEELTADIVIPENISLPSYDGRELRNQITSVNDFTMISERPEPANYKIRCVILELFPREYKTTDLIRMKCSECSMDETISNLFPIDPNGLRSAVQLYYLEHGQNVRMQCPICTEESCYFYFEIIFLLRDRTEREGGDHHMFACLEKQYAEAYLNLSPIEVVANLRDQEYAFLGKIDYLMEKFDRSPDRDCYMIINKDRDFYNIKQIKIPFRQP